LIHLLASLVSKVLLLGAQEASLKVISTKFVPIILLFVLSYFFALLFRLLQIMMEVDIKQNKPKSPNKKKETETSTKSTAADQTNHFKSKSNASKTASLESKKTVGKSPVDTESGKLAANLKMADGKSEKVDKEQKEEEEEFVCEPGMVYLNLEDLNPHLVCQICQGYFRDAHTIMECLHTFCKSCLLKEFYQGMRACPRCNVELGPNPLHVMLYDRTMQELVNKILPHLESEDKVRTLCFKIYLFQF
jgi:hypothetical protein